jgi:hypothetical protein
VGAQTVTWEGHALGAAAGWHGERERELGHAADERCEEAMEQNVHEPGSFPHWEHPIDINRTDDLLHLLD